MESKRQHILNLKPTFRGGPLVARVVRTWDVVYNQSNPSSFDMLLYDEQGGLIVATEKRLDTGLQRSNLRRKYTHSK